MAEKIIFTVRVYGADLESHSSSLAHIDRACTQAARDARAAGGAKLNGVILGDGAVEIGEWEYSPAAESA
jgi:hypothetical protein